MSNRTALKAFFQTGDVPTETQFADLIDSLAHTVDDAVATQSWVSGAYQPLDADLTTIAGLTATTDSFMQAKAGAWAARTIAEVKTDLGLTGTNSGDQNTFSTIAVSGQSNVVCDAASDTLTLVGSGVTITTDASTDTITFTVAAGGITTLNTLTGATQTFAVGTAGTDFAISSATTTHTFNLPDAGASARGVITTGTQTIAGAKTFSGNLSVGGSGTIFDVSTSTGGFSASYGFNTYSGVGRYFIGGVANYLGIYASSTSFIGFSSGTGGTTIDAHMFRAGQNSIQFGSSVPVAGAATTRTELNKAVASITDATPTSVLTITIPNAAHSASIRIRVTGSLGAGGAIGANEASATNEYIITICRTAGVNAVAQISSAFGAAAAAVAGADTVTCTAAMSAVSGAVGASNSFTVNVTITKSGGSSTNHTCLVYAQLMNANATGITIA